MLAVKFNNRIILKCNVHVDLVSLRTVEIQNAFCCLINVIYLIMQETH